MDLYYANREAIPGKDSKAVVGLSDLLNAMHRAIGTQAGSTIRNANGVYLKLMNLRALDPDYTSLGKVGMQSGGQLEKAIWAEYFDRVDDLAHDAAGVRQAVAQLQSAPPVPGAEPDIYEGEEGGVVIRLHKTYERDARLIRKKRSEAKASGALVCEVCGFDYEATYGALGSDYIEVHHTKPVHMMKPGSSTRLSDLALLCASCHRMAHRKRVPLTLDELRTALTSGM
ncbi:MAG: HNH endonuclease [Alphaproteobacteria bacterium]|nr:MAG: HNH endonuclease [Alphaproteobacteria bacterium]